MQFSQDSRKGLVALTQTNIENMHQLKDKGIQIINLDFQMLFPEDSLTPSIEGIENYHSLIDEIITQGIIPAIVLFDGRLPNYLAENGGWENRSIIQTFIRYAKVVFLEYGYKVPLWMTCSGSLDTSFGLDNFKGIHHLLLLHGTCIQLYKSLGLPGKIGFIIELDFIDQMMIQQSGSNMALSDYLHLNQWLLEPIYKGYYPNIVIEYLIQNGISVDYITKDFEKIACKMDYLALDSDKINRLNAGELGQIVDWVQNAYQEQTIYLTHS